MVIVVKVAETTEVKTCRIRGLGAKSCDPPLPSGCQSVNRSRGGLTFPSLLVECLPVGRLVARQLEEEWESIGGSDGTRTTGSLPHILSVNSSHRLPFTRSHIH